MSIITATGSVVRGETQDAFGLSITLPNGSIYATQYITRLFSDGPSIWHEGLADRMLNERGYRRVSAWVAEQGDETGLRWVCDAEKSHRRPRRV